MAMFLGGLEETSYNGWTLSSVVNVREKLYLTCPYFNCDTTTGTTAISGTVPTVDFARWKFTATGEQQLPATMDVGSGNDCDIRVEYDIANLMSSGAAITLKIDFSGTFVSVAINSTPQIVLNRNGTTSTAATTDRFGTLRLVRSGTSWSAYYWDSRLRAWSTALTGTQSVSGAGTGTLKTHAWGVRNVYPSVTSGTAESPVMDTEDGMRAIGWYTIAGTGTIVVEYRAGNSDANCSAASYVAATSWGPITPSSSNRFVQVRVTYSGGSTTAASPECGPVMIYSTIDAPTARLLFKRFLGMFVRHTDANYRMTINENASAVTPTFTALWSRAMHGVGRYFNSGGPASITFEGTTFDLAVYAIEGLNATATDITGDAQLLVEAANYMLPGLYNGRDALLNHANLTEARKDAWTTAIVAQIAVANSVNWYAFQMCVKSVLNTLRILDATSWSVYSADSDYSSPWASLEAQQSEGAWDDFETAGTSHYDVYTQVIGEILNQFCSLFTSGFDVVVRARCKVNAFNLRQIIDYFGSTITHGRSIHSAGSLHAGHTQQDAGEMMSSGEAMGSAREAYSRAIWQALRFSMFPGFDIVSMTIDRAGDSGSIEAYDTHAVVNSMVGGYMGLIGYSNICSARVPVTNSNPFAHAWAGMGIVSTQGTNANDPCIYFNGKDYDNAVGPGGRHAYQTGLNSYMFARNFGATQTIPRHTGQFTWRDSALSASNSVLLSKTTTPKCIHCGRAAVMWRSGVGQQWSSTIAGTDTVTTMTEVHVLYQHHATTAVKVALGARTMSLAFYISLGMPLASGASLSNADTTGHTYAENAEGLSAYMKVLEGGASLTLLRTGTDFYTGEANHDNRRNFKALPVDCTSGAISLTGNQYFGADQAYRHAAMVAATEDTWVGSYTRSTDLVTYEADAAGTPALVLVGLVAQTNPTTGNYTITGTVNAFVGSKTSPDWGGGSDITLVTYSSQNLVGLASAGNVSWDKVSAAKTRIRWDGGSALTAYPLALPSGYNRVYVMDWDGSLVNITRLCTITGTSVVVPVSAVNNYDFGLVTVDITAEGGISSQLKPFGKTSYRPALYKPGLSR